jgi:energy-coupling factor transporter ATP-binding protein EcfA2
VALSGGERQRVAIARALVNRPSMLMCDEPTGNLDSATTVELTDLLESLHRAGATLVVITHNPVVASRAQRQIAIRDGELTEISSATTAPQTAPPDPQPGSGAPEQPPPPGPPERLPDPQPASGPPEQPLDPGPPAPPPTHPDRPPPADHAPGGLDILGFPDE